MLPRAMVALRKESVDRNPLRRFGLSLHHVALRKESVDRNRRGAGIAVPVHGSLSARRAWIEITCRFNATWPFSSLSARRAWIEMRRANRSCPHRWSLSARRAWIEMAKIPDKIRVAPSLSARRAWIEISRRPFVGGIMSSRSPQGERG